MSCSAFQNSYVNTFNATPFPPTPSNALSLLAVSKPSGSVNVGTPDGVGNTIVLAFTAGGSFAADTVVTVIFAGTALVTDNAGNNGMVLEVYASLTPGSGIATVVGNITIPKLTQLTPGSIAASASEGFQIMGSFLVPKQTSGWAVTLAANAIINVVRSQSVSSPTYMLFTSPA